MLYLSLLANSADDKLIMFFSYFSKKIGFDILCKLSPQETICMKCQSLFSGNNKKKYFKLSSAVIFTWSAKQVGLIIVAEGNNDTNLC